jgi:acyl-CoA dehydrogenase
MGMEFAGIGYTEEQIELLNVATNFCRDKSPVSLVRQLIDSETGFDRAAWDEITALGWTAIGIPEQYNGAGLSLAEAVPVAEQMGRHMMATPFQSCTLAAQALIMGGNEAQMAQYLPQLAAGAIGTLALYEPHADWDLHHIESTAKNANGRVTLTGTKQFILWGQAADFIIVSVQYEGKPALVILSKDDVPAGAWRREKIIDETKRSAELKLDGISVPVSALMDQAKTAAALSHIELSAALLQSAEMCGGTLSVIDYTVGYLQTRKQFGNIIGSYQALKHPIVDAYVEYEKARSHLYSAAFSFGNQGLGEIAVRMAKASADKTYSFAADRAIQFHGGFGFTHDCDAGLHRRAAIFHASQFGDAAWHRAKLGELLFA